MKQLNFRLFNTNSEKFFETGNFFQKEANSAPKRPILFCSVYQGVLGHFATIDHLHDDVVLLLRPESFRVLLSCANWGFYYLNLAGISKFKNERKNEKYSGRSGKMTPSCKWPIPDYFRFTKTNEEILPLPMVSEEPSKHLKMFSSETVNIEKLGQFNSKHQKLWANNTKHYPHSDPRYRLHLSSTEI